MWLKKIKWHGLTIILAFNVYYRNCHSSTFYTVQFFPRPSDRAYFYFQIGSKIQGQEFRIGECHLTSTVIRSLALPLSVSVSFSHLASRFSHVLTNISRRQTSTRLSTNFSRLPSLSLPDLHFATSDLNVYSDQFLSSPWSLPYRLTFCDVRPQPVFRPIGFCFRYNFLCLLIARSGVCRGGGSKIVTRNKFVHKFSFRIRLIHQLALNWNILFSK